MHLAVFFMHNFLEMGKSFSQYRICCQMFHRESPLVECSALAACSQYQTEIYLVLPLIIANPLPDEKILLKKSRASAVKDNGPGLKMIPGLPK